MIVGGGGGVVGRNGKFNRRGRGMRMGWGCLGQEAVSQSTICAAFWLSGTRGCADLSVNTSLTYRMKFLARGKPFGGEGGPWWTLITSTSLAMLVTKVLPSSGIRDMRLKATV